MNEAELKRNPVLTDWVVTDLNKDPKLPYPDATFDVVTNAVSVDYLTKRVPRPPTACRRQLVAVARRASSAASRKVEFCNFLHFRF